MQVWNPLSENFGADNTLELKAFHILKKEQYLYHIVHDISSRVWGVALK